jgi:hypothetical protein
MGNDPEVRARLDEYATCFPAWDGKRPEPVKFCVLEGGDLVDWKDRKSLPSARQHPGLQAHSIYFDDGSVFDCVNGWRPFGWRPLTQCKK